MLGTTMDPITRLQSHKSRKFRDIDIVMICVEDHQGSDPALQQEYGIFGLRDYMENLDPECIPGSRDRNVNASVLSTVNAKVIDKVRFNYFPIL